MKKMFALMAIVVIVFCGCRTSESKVAYYRMALPIPNKIPNLVKMVDNTDIGLVYGMDLVPVAEDAQTENAVLGSKMNIKDATRAYTYMPRLNGSTSQHYELWKYNEVGNKVPVKYVPYSSHAYAEIPLYLHMFDVEMSRNVCEMTPEQYGYIELKVIRHDVISSLPIAIVEVRIYDKNKALVAIYNGTGIISAEELGSDEYEDYNGLETRRKLYIESFAKALNDIKVQIAQDSQRLNTALRQGGSIK